MCLCIAVYGRGALGADDFGRSLHRSLLGLSNRLVPLLGVAVPRPPISDLEDRSLQFGIALDSYRKRRKPMQISPRSFTTEHHSGRRHVLVTRNTGEKTVWNLLPWFQYPLQNQKSPGITYSLYGGSRRRRCRRGHGDPLPRQGPASGLRRVRFR